MSTPEAGAARSSRRRLELARQRLSDVEQRHATVRLAAELARRDRSAEGSVLAAALAARVFTWALPFALLCSSLLGFLGTGYEPVAELTDRLVTDPKLREQLASLTAQAEQGRYVTAVVGVGLLVVATVALGRTLDGVAAGVWGEPRARGAAQLRRAVRYAAALAGIALTHAVAVLLPGGPVLGVINALASFVAFVLLAGMVLGAVRGGRLAQGAVLVAAGLEAMRLVSFYYLPGKLERSSQLYGTLGIAAALLLWLMVLARLVVLGHVLNAHASAPTSPPVDDPRVVDPARGAYGAGTDGGKAKT